MKPSTLAIAAMMLATQLAAGELDIRFRSGNGSIRLTADQGSSRTISSVSPVIVLPNGGTGSIFSGSVRPFVVGTIPVVGGFSMPTAMPVTSPVREALKRMQMGDIPEVQPAEPRYSSQRKPIAASSAERGEVGLADIKAEHAAEDRQRQQQIASLVAQADAAAKANKRGVAKIYLRMAWRMAEGEQKNRLKAKLRTLAVATKR